MEMITAEALTERRELINAVEAASAALSAVSRANSGDMGIVIDRDAIAAEKAAWLSAEAALSAFYVRWPLKTYRREFTAETKRNRGWYRVDTGRDRA
jgi:hypothetical protein